MHSRQKRCQQKAEKVTVSVRAIFPTTDLACKVREREYCYEMKVIQAFSWMLFALFSFGFIILITLVNQAERFGRPDVWEGPIQELGG
jgi:hypothetical protein